MRANKRIETTGVLAVLALACAVALLPAPASAAPAGKSLENLMAAYDGESNAHARYLAFAEKADEEGYGRAASLFRAAAAAEEIHARAHADVIRSLGGTPKADVMRPVVSSTRENLAVALEGESYERDKMYPEFLAAAKAEKSKDAFRSFNRALTAEAEHAKLYRAALDDLASWKSGKTDFYVCTVCGYTTSKADFAKCPSCFSPREKLVTVS